MENPESPTASPPPAALSFKKWPECKKALNKLPHPIAQGDRDAILAGIETSPQKLQIAFEFLCWSRDPKFPSRLSWLEAPMVALLGGGDSEPGLDMVDVASEAKTWVLREFREIRTLADWNRFVSSGRHLWVLNAIFSTSDKKHIFVEALTALAECAEHCQSTDLSGKRKRSSTPAESPKWILKALKAKIPPKLGLPSAFLESLFAIHSTTHLGEELRRATNGLQFRLKNTLEELATEQAARQLVDRELERVKQQLQETSDSLARLQEELQEEKLHTTRQGGFNQVARTEAIQQVMAKVRQGVNHRLDNIAGFADRPNPNGEIIVELAQEIRSHLSGIEEAMKQ